MNLIFTLETAIKFMLATAQVPGIHKLFEQESSSLTKKEIAFKKKRLKRKAYEAIRGQSTGKS